MTRNGKIARLPRAIREQLNRRLQDGEFQNGLVEWLNSLPEVQAVLAAEFGGRPLYEPNLSEWKQGGYRDWVLQQEAVELVRHMDADSDELNQASKVPLTDLLAKRVTALYVVAVKALRGSNGEGEIDLKVLREFCADIVALRKGDHSQERLKIERDHVEIAKQAMELKHGDALEVYWKDFIEEVRAHPKIKAIFDDLIKALKEAKEAKTL